MAAEEAQKAEVEPECPPETPPAAAEVDEKAIVPLEPPPVPQENPVVDDSKALVPVEKPTEPSKDKPAEGSVNRDAVLARVSTEKKDALIKAWEESEKSKAENKAQQKISTIGAWENTKKAGLEAELKKIEENLEKKKAKYIEKQMNKIALLHKQAEEKRAMTEAKRGENLLKAEEGAAKWRATGVAPKKGWFSS
ncbi:hypothetical protein L6452_05167 [Arctium lappa]|uniref:Uncharacterized protein n=1 Tax=Arctium lappa TaxID=4217 RepID=A0ACB9EG32_ARCLA|nr:hypothetical protein L6452_05167 [Arctium lappa]